ncbi:GAF domain-containing protein [Rhizobium sp. BK538]|uniref:GAF domain-containing protein n=1 Tax=Rhizobium sp. BK538 TaxID=2586984 RepID=UPI00179D4525|nr:GAF domain-containing protein [Rhizobium sp. BK538]MBB4168803.1 signal transduction protein with GAF and PtsI domain [Rhizobium sp. BK538]
MPLPLVAGGTVRGVLFLESAERRAFTAEDEVALSIVARQAAVALALGEKLSLETGSHRVAPAEHSASEQMIRVVHHSFDDSVFVDGDYVIKGIAGRLLVSMLEQHLANGTLEFTNREIRLDAALKLPQFKDNLETRLLLLRRRLDEKQLPIRLVRLGRGRIGIRIEGRLRLRKDMA